MATLIIEIRLCVPGYTGGLLPELRTGFLVLSWCRGSLLAKVREWNAALGAAANKLRRLGH